MKQPAQHNQSVMDFLLYRVGSVQSIMEFCRTNNVSLTEDLIIGKSYDLSALNQDSDILAYFTDNGFVPASKSVVTTANFGIGQMIIEEIFIVG